MGQFVDSLTGAHRQAAADDLAAFVEVTVEGQSGLSGKLVKGAYAAAKKVDSSITSKAADRLLPDIAQELEPYWEQYQGSGEGSFGDFLGQHRQEVAEKVLATADKKAESVNNQALQKVYKPVRGKVASIVEDNVGGLGDVLEKHV
ncbi:MAG TPA: hypothetical protein H9867_02200 [Candidatus Corynebacterium gallistercoris]|uniref:Uncharacterized protein n=1 Tax=Candidatus Corynebacterium gallistercoris TaxID=2838530 RepID=A0A9D1RX86_9CORY|nr:hypothetical protein [Candidatus Corynebacterium gallistercoris]